MRSQLITEKQIQEKENRIGFLNDPRRMNVALTRSKYVLIIIGNA